MNIPSIVVICVLAVSLLGPLWFSAYLVFILPLFGSLALLPPELAGGSSLTPGSFAALFFIIKALGNRSVFRNSIRSLMDFRQLGFLSLFLIVAVLGAFVLPRIFEGVVHVNSMRTGQSGFLAPSITNYTQAIYLMLSVITAAVVAALMRNPSFVEILPKAILAGAWTVIITGLMDIVASHTGMSGLLSYFRTANYVFMTSNFIEETQRIIGLMPEASAFGQMAVTFCGLLLFLRPVFPPRLWRMHVPMATWGCGLMAVLSTSSTAYAMMAVLLCIYAVYDVHRVTAEGNIIRKTISRKILALMGAGVLCLLILIFDRDIMDHFLKLVDTLIFEKHKSTSYTERTGLTLAALDTFLESDGFGVGVGSVLSSNFFVSVLASTGVLGAGLFLTFLWTLFKRRAKNPNSREGVMIRAGKYSLLPIFVGLAVAGTTPDFGSIVGAIFGFVAGLGQAPEPAKWVSPHYLHKRAAAKPLKRGDRANRP